MAIFDYTNKDGVQYGTVGDECSHCRRDGVRTALLEETNYEAKSLDYELVYKIHIGNTSYCLCMDCFQKTLGDHVLINPNEIIDTIYSMEPVDEPEPTEEEKPKAKKTTGKKKEGDK